MDWAGGAAAEDAPGGVDQVGGLVKAGDHVGRGVGGQFDLDGPAGVAPVQDQVQFVAVGGAEEERLGALAGFNWPDGSPFCLIGA